MDAPTCGVCGSAHWLREPHKFKSEPKVSEVFSHIKPVTPVTADVTPVTGKVTLVTCANCSMLEAKVAVLEKELAKYRKPRSAAAEKQARYRARKRG